MTVFNKMRKTAQTHATDAIAMKTFLAFFFIFSTAMRCSYSLRSRSKRSASALRSAYSRSASSLHLPPGIFSFFTRKLRKQIHLAAVIPARCPFFVIWQSTFSRQSLLFLKSAVRLLPGADIVDVYLCVISFCTISGLFAASLCALDSLFRSNDFKYAAINTVAKDKMDDTIFIQSRSAKIVDRIPM